MIERARLRMILAMSAPISLSLLIQNLTMLGNAAMMGRLGVAALAGVGLGATIYTILAALLFGLDTGVQALVARQRGEGLAHLNDQVLTDAVTLSAGLGLVLTVAAMTLAPQLLTLIAPDPEVARHGAAFLVAVAPALLLVGALYGFGAFWNGSGKPRYPFLVTLVQVPCTLGVGAVLIFGLFGAPALGAWGAGVAAVVGAVVAIALHVVLLARHSHLRGFLSRRPSLVGMLAILRIGTPISLQQSFLHVGTATYYFIIGLMGAEYVAIQNVFIGIDHLAILPAIGAGIAAATFVGYSLGGSDPAGARRWGWDVARVATVLTVPVATVLFLFPERILAFFIPDPATVALAVWPARFLALSMCIDTFGRVLGFGLRGAAATRTVATVNFVMQWFVQLPAAFLIGIVMQQGLTGIAAGRVVLLSVECLIIVLIWRSGSWSKPRPTLAPTVPAPAPQKAAA